MCLCHLNRILPFPDEYEDDEAWENLFEGDRRLFESLLRRDWGRLGPAFAPLPTTARWTVQRMDVGPGGVLMPVLRDGSRYYCVLPTSAECTARLGTLSIPDPYHARDPAAGHSEYMARDTWFEDCGDGGTYVLGLDDTVLIFYVDGPGNMVYGRWQCDRRRWESMWLSAFGSLSVTIAS